MGSIRTRGKLSWGDLLGSLALKNYRQWPLYRPESCALSSLILGGFVGLGLMFGVSSTNAADNIITVILGVLWV